MSRHHRINYALAATLVASGVTLEQAAIKCGAKNANVLAVGLRRHGVTATKARSLEPTPGKVQTIAIRVASQASAMLREGMAKELQESATMLAAIPKRKSLKNLSQRLAVAEPLARTAKIVHGWSEDDSAGGLIALSRTITEDDPSLSCGVDTTSPSVVVDNAKPLIPQSTQAIDVQATAQTDNKA